MLLARCREPRPSQFSPRLQVRVISTSNIYLIFIYLFKVYLELRERGEVESLSGEMRKASGYLGSESHFHADARVMI